MEYMIETYLRTSQPTLSVCQLLHFLTTAAAELQEYCFGLKCLHLASTYCDPVSLRYMHAQLWHIRCPFTAGFLKKKIISSIYIVFFLFFLHFQTSLILAYVSGFEVMQEAPYCDLCTVCWQPYSFGHPIYFSSNNCYIFWSGLCSAICSSPTFPYHANVHCFSNGKRTLTAFFCLFATNTLSLHLYSRSTVKAIFKFKRCPPPFL